MKQQKGFISFPVMLAILVGIALLGVVAYRIGLKGADSPTPVPAETSENQSK